MPSEFIIYVEIQEKVELRLYPVWQEPDETERAALFCSQVQPLLRHVCADPQTLKSQINVPL